MKSVVKEIKKVIKNSANKLFPDLSENEIVVEIPRIKKFGDYSTSIAMKLAGKLKKKPVEIAESIQNELKNSSIFSDIDIVHPGFINFRLSKNFILDNLLQLKEKRLKTDLPARNILIEFVSANPTGPLNVVNARAAAVGDVLARVLTKTGDKVFKEYYINDAGNQVYLLGKTLLLRIKEKLGKKIELPPECYKGEYLIELAEEFLEEKGYNKIKDLPEEEQIEILKDYAIEKIVNWHKKDLEKFKVKFDSWFSERSLHREGKVKEALKLMKEKGLIKEENGKKIFISTKYGDSKDRVVVREDGRPTYFMADIAYHINKYERGFNFLIDLWGPDHDGYIPRMRGAIKALGYPEDSFLVKIIQQVNLVEKNKKLQMSKREGRFVKFSELLDEIPVDVSRFFFLHRTSNSHLDFDMELAKKQSEENPVYYIQYAHARICSIFKQAKSKNIEYTGDFPKDFLLINNEERALALKLIDFPDRIIETARQLEPNILTSYLLELATLFHKFYTVHKVLTDERNITMARLFICDITRYVIKEGLSLLGITAPERM